MDIDIDMDIDINMHIDMDIDMGIDINSDLDIDTDKKEPPITICIKYQIALPSVLLLPLKYGSWFKLEVSQAVWASPMVAKSIS